jgi:hypothetical protein
MRRMPQPSLGIGHGTIFDLFFYPDPSTKARLLISGIATRWVLDIGPPDSFGYRRKYA